MPQIFVSTPGINDGLYHIQGDDYHHLSRVLRVKRNDIINIRDNDGALVLAKIIDITDSVIIAEAVEKIIDPVPGPALNVAVSLLKGKKYDFVLQKLTELGVTRIVPVISERSIPVLKDRSEHKKDRWLRIVESASKQCMRADVPEVAEVALLEAYLSRVSGGIKIIAHPDGNHQLREFISDCRHESEVHLLIGPEGGFSDKEIDEAVQNGWSAVQFGLTSLRAETAAIILPALILYEWGS